MSHWEPFHFESNQAFGLVKNLEEWRIMLRNYQRAHGESNEIT